MSLKTQLLSAQCSTDLTQAAELLKAGEQVAVPTETVYGLAADASNPDAVAGIFTAKGRPANHPLIVHLGDVASITEWAMQIPDEAYKLANAFWPGPMTLLLPRAEHVSPVVTGGLDTIGLRVPAQPVLLDLLTTHQLAVAAPSANPYKKLSPTTAEQVVHGLGGKIAAVIDGGPCQHGLESTIVDLTKRPFRVLRAGPITASELSAVLGETVDAPEQHDTVVPGNVGSHYQPNTRLQIVATDLSDLPAPHPEKRAALLHFGDAPTRDDLVCITMPNDAARYGQALYHQLAQADQLGVNEIWLAQPPHGEAWLAVHDRLRRAVS
ncbi:threonylcarbamoyl-AMP synthase [Salinivibrio kushneri]|uniref:Threonylcarbamoyl-AMP synthase n=1 Tax=Salinivibrio kushneri TaxID=1908198 RepID=A0AB36K6L8_9GAMM|nr:L-threonylcarbamoyladenylate synthase [Salinivibrio kushneri]OOE44304.1 threonylcarbamoyl-AMP synthase [Salinivibrio kushneri]OOE47316.1 threonylcarbamoyl-AMP synthase [Salinivibrio kushneri]